MISIIIRTKNEERWIAACLKAVFEQSHDDFEVSLVDNESTDRTIEKAKQFPLARVLNCTEFRPGHSLNLGIRASRGEHIVCLSGHCIPVNNAWLTSLLANFEDPELAGVYGRQEPLSFTPDADKRDLSIVFGLDKKVQRRDSFFHNANSMIRRDIWERVPFDERVSNVEDRVWAHKVLQLGYKIIYEPEASVYHYHGIHHNGDARRAYNVVRILESVTGGPRTTTPVKIDDLNVVALIPIRGAPQYLGGAPLMKYTIEAARQSSYIKKVIVSTDNADSARIARALGAETPFLRDASLSDEFIDVDKVLQFSLNRIEELGVFPDLIVALEITFPFRPPGLIDDMIVRLVEGGVDSMLTVKSESRSIWREDEGGIRRVDSGDVPRKFKEKIMIGLKGVACVTHPEFIREGYLVGSNVGMYEIRSPYAPIEVRNAEDFELARVLLERANILTPDSGLTSAVCDEEPASRPSRGDESKQDGGSLSRGPG
ncbi:MAG: glycosyltransferase [Vicinamibacterales bacterium]|nr:glycosyltransferase [Vicinamibacterales bacterium]